MEGRQMCVALHRVTQGIIYFQRNKFSRSVKINLATEYLWDTFQGWASGNW